MNYSNFNIEKWDEDYSASLLRQAEEYYKPAWEKTQYEKGEKLTDGNEIH